MKKNSFQQLTKTESQFVDDKTSALLLKTPSSARVLLWIVILFFITAVAWSSWAQIDKVTVGSGKVIPSSQLQIVQNLEGGLVKEVLVFEGQKVEKGQQLLLIDDTRFRSDFREKAQDVANLTAEAVRISTELASIVIKNDNETPWQQSVVIKQSTFKFTDAFIKEHLELVKRQSAEYNETLNNLRNQMSVFDHQIIQKEQDLIELKARVINLLRSYEFAKKELEITQPLADEGIVPKIELLKLQREVNNTQRELTSTQLKVPAVKSSIREVVFKRLEIVLTFRSNQQDELNKIEDKLASLTESQVGLEDRVNRTVVVSPVTGTIKKIYTNTIGGVIQPGMDLIEIVPSEDNLLIEAKIAPQDIAFLRPHLPTIVKFSAYEFTRYGGLDGTLEHISADTIQDEEGNSFYLVRVRTKEKNIHSQSEKLPIIPGMTATVDIVTGKRTILDYILKPIIQAQQSALRE